MNTRKQIYILLKQTRPKLAYHLKLQDMGFVPSTPTTLHYLAA